MRTLLIFLLLVGLAYADSTRIIIEGTGDNAGDSAILDSIGFTVNYLGDSIYYELWTGPDTSPIACTLTIPAVYVNSLTGRGMCYYSDNLGTTKLQSFDDVTGTLIVNAPGGTDSCMEYGFVYDGDGSPSQGATVTWEKLGSNCIDTSNNNTILADRIISTTTGATGYFEKAVPKSKCWDCRNMDEYYKFKVDAGDWIYEVKRYTVPDSTTHRAY